VHDLAHRGAEALGFWVPLWEWLLNALGGAIAGLVVGAPIVAVLGLLHRHRSEGEAGASAH
jgi:uncharacterized protein